MELIAAEPLVASPVDLAYDEDGRAYVVEMRDYPYPEEKNAEPKEFPGTVRLLEDTDGDGRFDKSTVFADQLAWPTSAACWKGGVFVAAAPDIWYFKDTDGNGRADVRRKVFTGFGRYNVQAIMNNLRWGLDNKIYGAAAGNGGSIRHAKRPDEAPISLARRDFCFDPVTEKLEAISGGERFGNTFDDWGNRFVCNIRNPVQHVVLEQRYLARNPHLVVPRVIHDCAESGDELRVFRLSPPEPWRVFRAQRWALEGQAMPRSELIGAGYWTSSSGVTVYRGGAYPPEFRGNVFIGEVAGNLVHRQILTRDGVTFKSRRADEGTEFIRSRDNWFRPVNFVNAPDGTLHVLDMYRETIEHPWSIPDDIKAQLDLTSGKDRGRIYRLAPPQFTAPKPPKLSTATTAELVAHLESPHSWWRETAQRLLVERQDKSAIAALRSLIRRSKEPRARLHAIYALKELDGLAAEDIFLAPGANQPEVLRHAVLHGAPLYKDSPELRALVDAAQISNAAFVRLQVALSMGDAPPEMALPNLTIAARYGADDPWIRTAIVSSSLPIAGELAQSIDEPGGSASASGRRTLLRELSATVGSQGERAAIQRLLAAAPEHAMLAGLGQGLARRREKIGDYLTGLPDAVRQRLEEQIASAGRVAAQSQAHGHARLEALQLLAFLDWQDAREPLLACLAASEPREIQHATLRSIGAMQHAEAAAELIARWKQLTPPLREEAVNVLLSRPIWHEPLITALEKGDMLVSQLSIPQRSRLAAVKEPVLAERAKAVLGSFTVGPRKEIVDTYQAALSLKSDTPRGAAVYRRECANCHKLGAEGHEVGPNLATIKHRSPREILIHVLDPNREVSPNFLDYSVRLTDGRVLTGLIAAETDAGLTLRRAENREDLVLRSEIDEITSSGKSLMPEGLEQKIPQQEMADLIGFLLESK
jgi:putative membrane-bound dehydrogenase-like protein